MVDTRDPQVRDELMADGPIFDIVRRDAMAQWLAKPRLDDAENKFMFNVLSAKMFLEECAGGAA